MSPYIQNHFQMGKEDQVGYNKKEKEIQVKEKDNQRWRIA
jgi:hypothetical protein